MKPTQTFCKLLFVITIGIFLVIGTAATHAQWKQCNGPLGGYVRCMTQSGTTMIAGIYKHGVFRSDDKGAHWTKSGLASQDVELLISVGNSTFFACADSGVYRSRDNGASWDIILRSKNNERFRAFTMKGATIFAGSAGVGVYRSTDDGATWTETNLGIPTKDITSLAALNTTLFVGTNGKGVFRSMNNGESWESVFLNIPNPNNFNFERFIVTALDTIVFCGCDQGMLRSKDNGTTWESCDTGRNVPFVNKLQIIGSAIYTISGVYVHRSFNLGENWESVISDSLLLSVSSVANLGTDMFLGTTGGGIYKSTNKGMEWQQVNTGINLQSVSKLVSKGNTIYAGTEASGVYKTEDGGDSWTHLGLHSKGIETISLHDSIVLASTQKGIYRSTDDGHTWTGPVAIKFFASRIVYVDTVAFACATRVMPTSGTFRPIYKSLDHGLHWEEVNFELENTYLRACIAIGNTLFVVGNGMFRSTDFGETWQAIDNTLESSKVQDIAVVGTSLLVATSGIGVFRSDDMGLSWVKADSGLLSTFSYPICSNGSTMYIGNYSKGLFKSQNKGATWTNANAGLTTTSINSLCFAGSALYLGSDMGVWKLDNASDVDENIPQFKDYQSLICYPNPASSELTIDCTSLPSFLVSGLINYTVTSVTGEILLEVSRADARSTLSTDGLSAGVYCLSVRQGVQRANALFSVVK